MEYIVDLQDAAQGAMLPIIFMLAMLVVAVIAAYLLVRHKSKNPRGSKKQTYSALVHELSHVSGQSDIVINATPTGCSA
jgi:hypothetical protein